MDVFITNLDEDGAGIGEQVAGHGEAVAEAGEVGVDAVAPGIAEGLDLLGFAGDVVGMGVMNSARRRLSMICCVGWPCLSSSQCRSGYW